MKIFRYSVICLTLALMVISTGCTSDKKPVVNANSGVVIHSSDFGVPAENTANSIQKQKNKTASTVTVKNNVVNLGGGYENVQLDSVLRY